MKKTLYSTTFLATAGLLAMSGGDAFGQAAAPAAEKLKITVGGAMTQYVGWADQDDDWEDANNVRYKSFDQKSDSEIYFQGSVKLDSGITASVVVQLEADRSTGNVVGSFTTATTATGAAADFIDESYLRLTGAFGEVRLGSSNPGSDSLNVQAPFIGVLPYNTDQFQWIARPALATGATPGSTGIGGGADDNRVVYITPSLFGVRLGGSYAPSNFRSENQPVEQEQSTWDVGAQFAQKFGDFGVRVSTSYWMTQPEARSAATDNWSLGGDVTFADFTVGAAYGETEGKGTTPSNTASDVTHWNAGVKYAPGPFGVALTYQRAVADDTVADPDEDEVSRWTLGASYVLGPGVTAIGNVLHQKHQSEQDAATLDKSAWAVIGGISVSF